MNSGGIIKGFCLLILLVILQSNFIFAIPYSPVTDSQQFDSVQTLWSSTLENENGERLTVSFLRFNWTEKGEETIMFNGEDNKTILPPKDIHKSAVVTYLEKEGKKYLSDSVGRKDDISYESHFWGCLKGASVPQKFLSILELLIGKRPFSITPSEEEAFEKEGKKITNTPGTGAFNSKNCYDSCLKKHEDKLKGGPLSPEEAEIIRECKNECVTKFKCGVLASCNNYGLDGHCGIKEMDLIFFEKDKKEIFEIELKVEPTSGEVMLGIIKTRDPSKGISGTIVKEEELKIIEEIGDIYGGRFALGTNDIYKFDFLHVK